LAHSSSSITLYDEMCLTMNQDSIKVMLEQRHVNGFIFIRRRRGQAVE
jgi:hypothetical protein